MNLTEIIEQILGAIDQFEGVAQERWSKTEWTRRILTALCDVGTRLGYTVCASNVDSADWGEWLFDVCWLHGKRWLKAVPMVAECEWENFGDIEDDFQKLLVARASLRVMVCDGWWLSNDTKGKATADRLAQWVCEFEGSRIGDTYLLIIYEWHQGNRRSWRYLLCSNGTGNLPTFESL